MTYAVKFLRFVQLLQRYLPTKKIPTNKVRTSLLVLSLWLLFKILLQPAATTIVLVS